MKRIVLFWLAAMTMIAAAVTFAPAQSDSLGDYARSVRKEKKVEKVKQFDNDNLPRTDKLSIVGQPAAETPAQAAGDNSAPGADNPQTPKAEGAAKVDAKDAKASSPAEEKQKANDEWKKKIDEQKAKVDLNARELDVLQREYRLRAAAMYADAGNRLRNAGSWDQENEQYKKQIADKQKALDDAKKELEDLQETARKSGASAKSRE